MGIRQREDASLQRIGEGGNVGRTSHILGDQRLDKREHVLDAMIELVVQRLLANVGGPPLLGEDFRMTHHDVEELRPRRLRRLQIGVAPGLALRDLSARRLGLRAAKEEQVIARGLGQRRRKQAGRLIRKLRRPRQDRRKRLGRPNAARAERGDGGCKARNVLARRGCAASAPFARDVDADPIAGHQFGQAVEMLEKKGADVGFGRGRLQQAVELAARERRRFQHRRPLESLDPQRKNVRNGFRGDPLGKRQRSRLAVAADD